jgi:hypothetical protein
MTGAHFLAQVQRHQAGHFVTLGDLTQGGVTLRQNKRVNQRSWILENGEFGRNQTDHRQASSPIEGGLLCSVIMPFTN